MANKQKESPFSYFVKNGIGFLKDAKSIWNSLFQSNDVMDHDVMEYREMHKIAHLARCAESFVKALMLIYDEIILFPVFLLMKKVEATENERFQEVKELGRKLKNRAISIEKLEKLNHDPVLNSEIPQIFLKSSEILFSINEKELGNVYKDIYSHLNSFKGKKKSERIKQRKFSDVQKLRVKLTENIDMAKYMSDALEALRGTLNLEPLDEKVRESIKYMEKNPNIFKNLVNIVNIWFQELIDLLLLTDYLSDATTKGFYPSDINAKNYLDEIREMQSYIMDYLSSMGDYLHTLIKNPEFIEAVNNYYKNIGGNIID